MRNLMRLSLSVCAAALALAALLAAVAPPARAADWCVDPAGGSCFTTIQAAVNAAAGGDTIAIHAGTYYEHVTVNKTLALVGAGADQTFVDGSGTGRVFEVTADGVSFSALTIQNGSTSGAGGGINANSGGSLTLTDVDVLSNTSAARGGGVASWRNTTAVTGGRFENNRGATGGSDAYGGGLYAQTTLVVSGTRFISNTIGSGTAGEGGGAYGNGATTVTAAQFVDNTAKSTGGGLYLWRGAATVTGSLFRNNWSAASGGGIFMADAGNTLTVNGTQFISNTTASYDGGGVATLGNLTVTGGRFENNTSLGYHGGGLYAQYTLVVSGTQFVSNTVTNTLRADGGGAYGASSTTITNAQFIGNVAALSDGGGLYGASSVALFDTQFLGNRAVWRGGGAHAVGNATVVGGLFQDNLTVKSDGGGLATESALILTGTQFLSNTGQSKGGGAYASGPATVTGALFRNNHTNQFEGGGLATWSTLTLSSTQFISNFSIYNGGGAFSVGAATVTGGLFQNNRTVFDDHSGGGLDSASTAALTDTLFLGNSSIWNGGGLHASGAITMVGGRFENNYSARYGGGLCTDNTLTLAGTRFISNTAAISGGGLMLGSGAGRVVNALFARNSAGRAGAGLYLLNPAGAGGSVQVIHTTIASPTVGAGSGQAIVVGNGAADITNTVIANYAAGVETAISGTATSDYNLFFNAPTSVVIGSHSITGADPLLVNLAGDDYHLALGSPAIDNGMDAGVATDLDGVTRPQGARYDIGAYEFDSPFLTLAKTITPTGVISYQGTITYTIVLSNISVVNDTTALMTDTLPAPVGFGAWVASPPAGTILSDKTIMWTGSVAAGQVLTWTFTATQTGDDGALITNTAHFSGTEQAGDATATFRAAGLGQRFIFLPVILNNR